VIEKPAQKLGQQEWTGSSVPESFESAVGTGAQLTTFYTALDERQRALWADGFTSIGIWDSPVPSISTCMIWHSTA